MCLHTADSSSAPPGRSADMANTHFCLHGDQFTQQLYAQFAEYFWVHVFDVQLGQLCDTKYKGLFLSLHVIKTSIWIQGWETLEDLLATFFMQT